MRQCNTLVSSAVFILLGLISIGLGSFAWSNTSSLYLPFPTWIPAVATLISPMLVLALIIISAKSSKGASQQGHAWCGIRLQSVIAALNQFHTVLSTALAIIALAYLFPERLMSCNIEQQWQQLFQAKNSEALRTIQDNLQCCGLRSTRDRAWPFKDKEHGDDACELQLRYTRSCLKPWMGRQRNVSWMTFAAVILIIALRVGIMTWNGRKSSWLKDVLSTPENQRHGYRRITNDQDDIESGDNSGASGAINDYSVE